MSTRRKWIQTREDLIDFLKRTDGQVPNEPLDAWEIDDFTSVRHPNPVVEKYRLQIRDQLVDLFASRDEQERSKIGPAIARMISELEANAED